MTSVMYLQELKTKNTQVVKLTPKVTGFINTSIKNKTD